MAFLRLMRPHKSKYEVNFRSNWRDYYLGQDEECPTCPSNKQPANQNKPDKTIFHCLKCHKNKAFGGPVDLNKELRKHYTSTPKKNWLGAVKHDINSPPRFFIADSYDKLSEMDKLLAKEGEFNFSFIKFRLLT